MSVNEDLSNKYSIDVSDIQFKWDIEKGIFDFEGNDAVLFWISSAMKTFEQRRINPNIGKETTET